MTDNQCEDISSGSPMSDSLVQFTNIPLELWGLIYRYLSQSDLLQGALVSPNHSLSRYCQSQIWANLNADDWVFEGIYEGFSRNAALVHKIATSPRTKLENLAVPTCQNVTHLNMEESRFLRSAVLEKLLEYNHKCLQSLRLRLDATLSKVVIEMVSKSIELRELYLHHWDSVNQDSLESILESLPRVEVLSLGYNALYPFKLDTIRQNNPSSDALPIEKTPFKIKTLILDKTTIFHDELILNIASRCPSLEHISMRDCFGIRLSSGFIDTLANLCPRLHTLDFSGLPTTQDFFKSLFHAIPNLTNLRVSNSNLSDSDVDTMIFYCSPTLQVLEIASCESLTSRSIFSILMNCPRLVQFDAQQVDFNPREMMEPLDEWACTQLEYLSLEISLPKRYHYAIGEPDQIRNKVYQQLSRLTELRYLNLGSGSKDRGVGILEMSLLTGLSTLSALSRLESLDIKRLNHAARGSEVKWMLRSWPNLRRLGILLENRFDVELLRASRHGQEQYNKHIYIY